MRLTFKGGVHPFEGKEMSKDCPVEKYLPKGRFGIPIVPAHWCSGEACGCKG